MKGIPVSVFSARERAGRPLWVGFCLLLVLLWARAQAFDEQTLDEWLRQLRDTGWSRGAPGPFADRAVTGCERQKSPNVDFWVHKIGREGPRLGTDPPPGKVHKRGLLGPQTGTFGSTNRDFAPQLTNSNLTTTKPPASGAVIDIGVRRRTQVEAEFVEVVVELGLAGTCPGHGFVSPAVERLLEGAV